jgi:hypothetical protein
MNKRKETMRGLSRLAKQADKKGDITMRWQYSQNWREYATEAECKKAPKYLTWTGRRS